MGQRKGTKNIRKHGIDFQTAALVFDDLRRIELFDEKHSRDEDRYITIRMVNKLPMVVYTERSNAIRLISARKATQREEECYVSKNGY